VGLAVAAVAAVQARAIPADLAAAVQAIALP
jgi:hypothetical protein